ncbi:MAG: hypothetical protein H6Q67_1551, partial [Firmicutes bacterium]|nr:hypothetical protein [Bacillota bacterium]
FSLAIIMQASYEFYFIIEDLSGINLQTFFHSLKAYEAGIRMAEKITLKYL